MHSSRRGRLAPILLLLSLSAACAGSSDTTLGDYTPPDGDPPLTPAPTGQKWEGGPNRDDCGRNDVSYKLVDELCGGLDEPDYLDTLRIPMIRDGVIVGDLMYAVDASHVWVLDPFNGDPIAEKGRISGVGEPLAIGAHGSRLLVASGAKGLVVFSLGDPLSPSIAQVIPLPGPALDVYVKGDRAVVAMGRAGFAVVDLSGKEAVVALVADTPHFAAGVAVDGDDVLVADCNALRRYTLSSDAAGLTAALVSQHTHPDLPNAPYRDVEVVGQKAYVAGGRDGTLIFSLDGAEAPTNCASASPSFYVSGVRASQAGVYAACGEWGVMAVPSGCEIVGPPPPLPTPPSTACSKIPPSQVVPWTDPVTLPPPPSYGRDPIQVLPTADTVYAFGEAARLGFRSVQARSPKTLALVRRWDEPTLALALAARDGKVLVVGPRAGVFHAEPDGALTPLAVDLPLAATRGTAAHILSDGRWVIADTEGVHVEGADQKLPITHPIPAGGLASFQNLLVYGGATGLEVVAAVDGTLQTMKAAARVSTLPAAVAMVGTTAYMASPEWEAGWKFEPKGASAMKPHGVFTATEASSISWWRAGLPRRLLFTSGKDVVEVSMLGPKAAVTAPSRFTGVFTFPRTEMVSGAASATHAYMVSTDRRGYTSRLHTLHLTDQPAFVDQDVWVGQATSLALDGSRLFVSDAAGTIRVYDLVGDLPTLVHVHHLDVEVTP